MKLVIQIPCFNEATTLPETIRDLPRSIPGVQEIEILVVDDGSTDGTPDVARRLGVHHVLELTHKGLAAAFSTGLKYAVSVLNADIIVNTDADNQYKSSFIAPLIQPILQGSADIVVGCRPIHRIPHFSRTKKFLQRFGTRMVRFLTNSDISDVTSGFRAYSRNAARRLRVFSDFSYTIETLIQASKIGLRIAAVDIEINPPTRKSRLFVSNFHYIRRQTATILRIWALYSPVKLFSRFGAASIALGVLLVFRFLFYYFSLWPNPSGKVQSLIIAAVLLIFGLFMILIGVIADLIAVNRHLTEEVIEKLDALEQKISK